MKCQIMAILPRLCPVGITVLPIQALGRKLRWSLPRAGKLSKMGIEMGYFFQARWQSGRTSGLKS
jgi:hypothetical protein